MPLNGIRSSLVGRRCRQRLRSVIVEADMSEMTSTSESEIHAVMEEQARKKQEDQRNLVNVWNTAAIREVIWEGISVADPI